MRNRLFQVTSAMTIALGVAMSMAVLVAQAPSGTKKALPQTTTSTDAAIKASADAFKKSVELKTYVVPKKPWGEPDLSGVWLTATYTRLQRPAELGSPSTRRRPNRTRKWTRGRCTMTGRSTRWTRGRAAPRRTCAPRSSSIRRTDGCPRSCPRRSSGAPPRRRPRSSRIRCSASRRSATCTPAASLVSAPRRSCAAACRARTPPQPRPA